MSAPTAPRPTADWVECVDCAHRGIGYDTDLITGHAAGTPPHPARELT